MKSSTVTRPVIFVLYHNWNFDYSRIFWLWNNLHILNYISNQCSPILWSIIFFCSFPNVAHSHSVLNVNVTMFYDSPFSRFFLIWRGNSTIKWLSEEEKHSVKIVHSFLSISFIRCLVIQMIILSAAYYHS